MLVGGSSARHPDMYTGDRHEAVCQAREDSLVTPMNDHLSVVGEVLSVKSEGSRMGGARSRTALLLWGAWVVGLFSCSTSESAKSGSTGDTGSTVATGSPGAGGGSTSSGAAGSRTTGSRGSRVSTGAGGAAGDVGTGGAPPMGGGPCVTTPGTNQANLTVRRPEISTRRLGAEAAANVVRVDRDPLSGNI